MLPRSTPLLQLGPIRERSHAAPAVRSEADVNRPNWPVSHLFTGSYLINEFAFLASGGPAS